MQNRNAVLRFHYLQSLLMFMVAYCLLQLNSQLLTIYISRDFYIDVTWYFSQLEFNPALTAPYVSTDTRMAVVMAAPIVSLLIGLVLLLTYLMERTGKLWVNYFFFWGFIHSFNHFFGMLAMSSFTETELVVATHLYNIGWPTRIIFAATGIFLLFIIGWKTGQIVLIKTGRFFAENRRLRLRFLMASTLLPMFSAGIMLTILNILSKHWHYWWLVSLSIAIVPAFFRYMMPIAEKPVQQKYRYRFSWGITTLCIIFVAGYFIITQNGIKI